MTISVRKLLFYRCFEYSRSHLWIPKVNSGKPNLWSEVSSAEAKMCYGNCYLVWSLYLSDFLYFYLNWVYRSSKIIRGVTVAEFHRTAVIIEYILLYDNRIAFSCYKLIIRNSKSQLTHWNILVWTILPSHPNGAKYTNCTLRVPEKCVRANM